MLQGFADSFPSESIQAHSSPGLAVSVLFPFKSGVPTLEVPVAQYKDVKLRNKASRAKALADWLREQKSQGLIILGFMLADNWESAADLGLRFLRELPKTSIQPHYDSFRLLFGDRAVDFSQAVALQYYFFVLHMGCLRAGLKLPLGSRNLEVLMDRFPHSDTGGAEPGVSIPLTPGMQLLEYMDGHSATWVGIRDENRKIELDVSFGNLNWWRESEESEWRKGKTHPHFKLPDWLNQAIIADEHYDEYVASFDDESVGREVSDALRDLRAAFQKFDIWMMRPDSIGHIVPNEELWEIPEEVREFIMKRITNNS